MKFFDWRALGSFWFPLFVVCGLAWLWRVDPKFYAIWIASEDRGLLEFSHLVLPLAASLVALWILIRGQAWRQTEWLVWYGLAALGCFYIAGEEASWGQHYFGWATPEGWLAVNDQSETNLHNTSSWFDQKPRALLEIGVVVGGIILPLVERFWPNRLPPWLRERIAPLSCLPVAILVELVALSERLPEAFGSKWMAYPRTSEVQEFCLYLFLLIYLLGHAKRYPVSLPDSRR